MRRQTRHAIAQQAIGTGGTTARPLPDRASGVPWVTQNGGSRLDAWLAELLPGLVRDAAQASADAEQTAYGSTLDAAENEVDGGKPAAWIVRTDNTGVTEQTLAGSRITWRDGVAYLPLGFPGLSYLKRKGGATVEPWYGDPAEAAELIAATLDAETTGSVTADDGPRRASFGPSMTGNELYLKQRERKRR